MCGQDTMSEISTSDTQNDDVATSQTNHVADRAANLLQTIDILKPAQKVSHKLLTSLFLLA